MLSISNANPPKLTDTVTVGKQPSGLSISHKGDLALIANRAGKSVSIVSIDNGAVKSLGATCRWSRKPPLSSLPRTPGKRAFVCLNLGQ